MQNPSKSDCVVMFYIRFVKVIVSIENVSGLNKGNHVDCGC